MRFSLIGVIYIVVGVLVAAGILGDERNYFNDLDDIEAIVNMLLAVFLWPLILLGVSLDIGDADVGDGGGDRGGNGGGGSSGGGASGGQGGGGS